MLEAQTYKYHHKLRLQEYLLTTISYIILFCKSEGVHSRGCCHLHFITMTEENTRPVFFFDIDNCVSFSLLDARLLLTIVY